MFYITTYLCEIWEACFKLQVSSGGTEAYEKKNRKKSTLLLFWGYLKIYKVEFMEYHGIYSKL